MNKNGFDLQKEVSEVLNDYGSEVAEAVSEAVVEVSKMAVKKLKQRKSFASDSKATGKYAKGWKSKIEKSRMGTNAIVYNAVRPDRIHLLENGHITRNGNGRTYPMTPAYSHVAPVEQEVIADFEKIIAEKVKG